MKRIGLSLICLVSLLAGCPAPKDAPKDPPALPAAPAPAPSAVVVAPEPPPPPPEETPVQKLMKMDFTAAVEFVKPQMTDVMDNTSDGAALLAVWGMTKMKFSDVSVPKNETSFALAQKDPDEARGKRICVSGRLIQIQVTKTDLGKVNEGLLMTDSGNLYNYSMVGGSGELVARSRAKMCGVVIGKYDYHNSGGGTGHAIHLVGMFDLPENKI